MDPSSFLYGYSQDPQYALAQALMRQGSSAEPTMSPWAAAARVLTGGIGALQANQVRGDWNNRQEGYLKSPVAGVDMGATAGMPTMASALQQPDGIAPLPQQAPQAAGMPGGTAPQLSGNGSMTPSPSFGLARAGMPPVPSFGLPQTTQQSQGVLTLPGAAGQMGDPPAQLAPGAPMPPAMTHQQGQQAVAQLQTAQGAGPAQPVAPAAPVASAPAAPPQPSAISPQIQQLINIVNDPKADMLVRLKARDTLEAYGLKNLESDITVQTAGRTEAARLTARRAQEPQLQAEILTATNPLKTDQAVEEARRKAPIQTDQAVDQARRIAPIDVGKAHDIAEDAKKLALEWDPIIAAKNIVSTSKANADRPLTVAEVIDNERSSKDKFDTNEVVKQHVEASNAYASLLKAAKAADGKPDSGVSDVALVDAATKLFNPGGVLRQGSFNTMIDHLQGLPDDIKGQITKMIGNGATLSPEARSYLVDQASLKMGSYRDNYRQLESNVRAIAKRQGLNPDNVAPPFVDALTQREAQQALDQRTAAKKAGATGAY